MTTLERFWAKVDRRGPDECWEWKASKRGSGYGQISIGGVLYYAHKYAYNITNGLIPDGQVVRHSCDNKLCCNPAHLIGGTQKENVIDAYQRGQIKPTRLSIKSINRLHLLRADGYTQAEVANALGISRGYVSLIETGRRRLPSLQYAGGAS